MKKNFPRYKQGELKDVEKKLSLKSKQLLKEFLKKCSITAGEGKLEKIKRIILQFYDVTETELDKQTKETINSYLIILNKSDRSVWTKNEAKVYVKQFLKWHYKDYEMIENIRSENYRIDHKKVNENNLITEEDVEKMLRHAESYREKAYLFLIFELGARPQEILNLKWRDIKFEDKYADVTLFSDKTGKSRTFPVCKSKEHLWNWKQNYSFPNVKSNDLIFPTPRNRDKPLTSVGANKMLRRISKKAKIEKDIWNYLFRHSKATRLYEELPQQICEKLLGHKNMAGIYAHISNKKAREMMLNKIYHIEKLTEQEKDEIKELKRRIELLEQNLKSFLNKIALKDMDEVRKVYKIK